jgi:hypothetical protein
MGGWCLASAVSTKRREGRTLAKPARCHPEEEGLLLLDRESSTGTGAICAAPAGRARSRPGESASMTRIADQPRRILLQRTIDHLREALALCDQLAEQVPACHLQHALDLLAAKNRVSDSPQLH